MGDFQTADDWWIERMLAIKAAWAEDQERLRVAEARLVEVEQALRDARECRHDVDDHSLSGTDDGWWRCDACGCRVQMRAPAVLDKGESDG